MKKYIIYLMTAIVSLALLSGCNSTKKEENADGNQSNEDVKSENESGKVLVVGTNAEFPPFEYVGDDGKPDGFDMALIREIGNKMGMDVQVENMEFASLVSSIGTKIDVAIAGMTVTAERSKAVDFSDPYYNAVQYVILQPDSDIKKAEDLENKTIGVQLGTTGDFIVEDIPGAKASQYNKAVDAVNDLLNGRVDCVIIDKNPALVFESKYEGQVITVNGDDFGFEAEDYAIAISKGDTELLNKINESLKELKEDGTYDELVKEYIEQ